MDQKNRAEFQRFQNPFSQKKSISSGRYGLIKTQQTYKPQIQKEVENKQNNSIILPNEIQDLFVRGIKELNEKVFD